MVQTKYEVLVIDDSRYIADLVYKILELKGHSCHIVDSSSKAFDLLKGHKPKLIFLDVHLPNSSGYEFCNLIKSDEKYKDILVYYFSGAPESEVAIKALETRADGYLKKPFDLSDFDEILDHLN
ncbi:MAG: response regulator [Promethearchaeota archaeon]|jgi:CheY-like chemotaxis protein